MIALLLVVLISTPMIALAEPVTDSRTPPTQPNRTAPLTIEEVLARIELTHPLLQATGTERMKARAKVLKALGAWEPTVKNITEIERYETWNLTTSPFLPKIQTGGFNDTKIQVGHPWGFQVVGGIRNGMGDRINQNFIAIIPDLQLFYPQQQLILGGSFQLLRGLIINEENAEFQQAELAGPLAEVKVAQKRQDLYLAGAVQYWDWQVAVKQAEVQKQALAVAEARYQQIEGQAKAGKVSPLDVVEIGQE
ncbi:MAG: TolC family protein, partial [Nitrospira sp.]|nr:TolC family protein [Nitrospira sp.]